MNDVIDFFGKPESLGFARHAFDQLHECDDAGRSASGEFITRHGTGGTPHRAGIGTRIAAYGVDRACADAARRTVDDTFERGVIVTIGNQA